MLRLSKVRNCQFIQAPFRLPVGHQALLPYALCIGPKQQASGSSKTVCFLPADIWSRAIRQASRILEKIDERWPMEEQKALDK